MTYALALVMNCPTPGYKADHVVKLPIYIDNAKPRGNNRAPLSIWFLVNRAGVSPAPPLRFFNL